MKRIKWISIVVVLLVVGVTIALAAGPTGAIFTTTPDGSIVNENVRYTSKLEVYLDGGPGPNAPQTAAGLDDGLYVFQVTDPSGKYLLSQDPAKCRVVEVKDGVIFREVPATELGFAADTYTVGTKTYPCRILDGDPSVGVAGPSGRHDWNYDLDHSPAIVVQLMPFGDTPNPGGVYKAWMTPLAKYTEKGGLLGTVPVGIKGRDAQPCPNFCAASDVGFTHPDVKTDNFKVKGKVTPPEITVKKFHDKNMNGVFDNSDEWVTGWPVDYTDPLGNDTTIWTPWTIVAEPPGLYSFLEDIPANVLQTASYLDGLQTVPFPTNPVDVTVLGTSGEKHEVVFGNVGKGEVTVCKGYDRDADGEVDEDEPLIPGWKFSLSGTLLNGDLYGPEEKTTGEDGCVTFGGLLPGSYTMTEIVPSCGWYTEGALTQDFDIESTLTDTENGPVILGSSVDLTFANYCVGSADFGTKGYWHNKNGLSELTQADIDYVNGLPPYSAPSSYFDDGDEPFDGLFMDGTPVAGVTGEWGEEIAPAGSWQAEVSRFLVDANANGDPREQLAQQLLAFIFNVRHRLDDPGVAIQVNGEWVSAQSIIDAAIAAWQSPGTDDDHFWEPILDALNNNDAVLFIHYEPCEVIYP